MSRVQKSRQSNFRGDRVEMRKACIVVGETYKRNRLFDLSNIFLNRDNCLVPMAMLRTKFAENGFDLSTQDINQIGDSECVIYLEMPLELPQESDIEKSFLLIFETELILPLNWDFSLHRFFKKIFTWNDDLVDFKKYFKINWSHIFPINASSSIENKTKFCCLIAGNKSSKHPLELYSKRLEVIRWFEKNHPESFELFGMGWNDFYFPNKFLIGQLNRLIFLRKLLGFLAPRFPSFKGKIKEKKETLKQFKFSICYENAKGIPGYITEKIFDCFFACCVPIYWGAENVSSHVPKGCFIDKREFDSYEDLFRFLSKMSTSVYASYIDSAQAFLESPQSYVFTAKYFVETLFRETVQRKISTF